ncbi:hypothetical protein PENTCL1PPCAC_17004, partial [Pristionchus entomophagus]
IPTTPTYKNGRFELVCLADCGIGYAETATKFTYEATMRITCESTGWLIKTATNTAGTGLSSVKVGCFRKIFSPSTNCPAIPYLNQSLVFSFVGITVETTQTVQIAAGVNQLKCSANTFFAYIAFGQFNIFDWWMTCGDSATDGWRIRDATGRNSDYLNRAVGCVKREWIKNIQYLKGKFIILPSCTGLVLFDGSESIVTSTSNYEFSPAKSSFGSNGKFEIICPANFVLGYESITTITLDASLKVTCESSGWWVKSALYGDGAAYSPEKIGCLKATGVCI